MCSRALAEGGRQPFVLGDGLGELALGLEEALLEGADRFGASWRRRRRTTTSSSRPLSCPWRSPTWRSYSARRRSCSEAMWSPPGERRCLASDTTPEVTADRGRFAPVSRPLLHHERWRPRHWLVIEPRNRYSPWSSKTDWMRRPPGKRSVTSDRGERVVRPANPVGVEAAAHQKMAGQLQGTSANGRRHPGDRTTRPQPPADDQGASAIWRRRLDRSVIIDSLLGPAAHIGRRGPRRRVRTRSSSSTTTGPVRTS